MKANIRFLKSDKVFYFEKETKFPVKLPLL